MRKSALVLAAALALSAALSGPVAAQPRAVAVTPAALFAAYRAAMDRIPPLGYIVFEYAETRTGPSRTLSEQHRVYRSINGSERNETIAVNGTAIVPALVHFTKRAEWPYDVRRFAVDGSVYNVLPLGATIVGGRRAIGYSTVRAVPGEFAITRVYVDERRALPVRVMYQVSGGGCAGSGWIDFAPAGPYWLPTATSVTCTVSADNSTFRESIRFSAYRFPSAIPADVFRSTE